MSQIESASDQELMEGVRNGQNSCAEALCQRYSGALYNYFANLTGDCVLSQDLVQDTFLRLLRYGGGYRGTGPFRVWLFRLARSAANAYFRKAPRPWVSLEDVNEPAALDPASDPLETLGRRRSAERLRTALGQLSPGQREVLLLRRFEGLDYGEIAAICSSTPTAIRVRFHRALRALARAHESLSERIPT